MQYYTKRKDHKYISFIVAIIFIIAIFYSIGNYNKTKSVDNSER